MLSIYKAVGIQVDLTKDLHYVPRLKRFEDVALVDLVLKKGLKTLKVFNYSYRSVNLHSGGCADQRDINQHQTHTSDLVEGWNGSDDCDACTLPPFTAQELEVVRALLAWVDKAQRCDAEKLMKKQMEASHDAEVSKLLELAAPPDLNDLDDENLPSLPTPIPLLQTCLMAHQISAVKFLLSVEQGTAGGLHNLFPGLSGAVLADDMGLGKVK